MLYTCTFIYIFAIFTFMNTCVLRVCISVVPIRPYVHPSACLPPAGGSRDVRRDRVHQSHRDLPAMPHELHHSRLDLQGPASLWARGKSKLIQPSS